MSPSIAVRPPRAAAAGAGSPARRAIPSKARLLRLYVRCWPRFGPQALVAGPHAVTSRRGRRSSSSTPRGRAPPAPSPRCARRGLLTPRRLAAPPKPTLARADPPGRHLPAEGPAAARLHPLAARALRRATSRGMRRAPLGPLRRELLGVSGPRAGDGRRHPALRGRAAGVRRRRLRAPRAGAPPADAREAGLRGRRARSSRRTCPPIPRCSTSFTPCSSPSPRRTAAPCPRCDGCPLAPRSRREAAGAPLERPVGATPPTLREEVDEALGGVGNRERAGALAHLLEAAPDRRAAPRTRSSEPLGRERRLGQDRGAAGALDEPRVRRLLVAAACRAAGCRARARRAGSTR